MQPVGGVPNNSGDSTATVIRDRSDGRDFQTQSSLVTDMSTTTRTSPNLTKYVVVTPVRDEQAYVRFTLDSVVAQTVRPTEWIIVDDGSTDKTGAILDEYAKPFSWIRVIHRPDRGFRKPGGGVVDAFYDGYKSVIRPDWEFVVKLDGDLTLPPDYFQSCFDRFFQDPSLGIAGGALYCETNGRRKSEVHPRFHVRGATKIYKRACWEAIGGLFPAPGWDTIDEVKANMLGWKTCTFPDVQALHHRLTGTADGLVRDNIKHGLVCYVCGYHPLFLAASCINRLARKPYIIGSAAIVYGFAKGHVRRHPRVNDARIIQYLRKQQLKRLFGGQTIWK